MSGVSSEDILSMFTSILSPDGAISSIRQGYKLFPVDIFTESKVITIVGELPGIDAKEISVEFNSNKIEIIAEKKKPETVPSSSEIMYGKFRRLITLPICVTKKESVMTSYSSGMLTIRINRELEDQNKFKVPISS